MDLTEETIAKIMQDDFGLVRSAEEEVYSSIDFQLVAKYSNPDSCKVSSSIITVPFTLTVIPPFEGEKARLFVSISTDWPNDRWIYAWADGVSDTDLFGGWGGYKIEGNTVAGPDGNQYFEIPLNDKFYGATVNLIIHDEKEDGMRVEGQAVLRISFAEETEDVYLRVVGDDLDGYSVTRVEKPLPKLYVKSDLGWSDYAMYVWPEDDELPGWPGVTPVGTIAIDGDSWMVYEVTKPYTKKKTNWIINNNNNGQQYDLMQGYEFTNDTYVRVAADGSFTVAAR